MGCAGASRNSNSQSQANDHPLVLSSIQTARQVEKQDVEVDSFGEVKLRQGVAQERRISVEDEEMRHVKAVVSALTVTNAMFCGT